MFPWFAESTCLTAKTADVEEAWTERRPVGVVVPIPTFPFSNKFRFVPTANPPVIVVVALAFPMAVNPVRVVIEGNVVVEVIQKSDEVVAHPPPPPASSVPQLHPVPEDSRISPVEHLRFGIVELAMMKALAEVVEK